MTCCRALTASCLSCTEGVSVDAWCEDHPETVGCGGLLGGIVGMFSSRAAAASLDPMVCCMAQTASCLACTSGEPIAEFCRNHPDMAGCDDAWNTAGGMGVAITVATASLIGVAALAATIAHRRGVRRRVPKDAHQQPSCPDAARDAAIVELL